MLSPVCNNATPNVWCCLVLLMKHAVQSGRRMRKGTPLLCRALPPDELLQKASNEVKVLLLRLGQAFSALAGGAGAAASNEGQAACIQALPGLAGLGPLASEGSPGHAEPGGGAPGHEQPQRGAVGHEGPGGGAPGHAEHTGRAPDWRPEPVSGRAATGGGRPWAPDSMAVPLLTRALRVQLMAVLWATWEVRPTLAGAGRA